MLSESDARKLITPPSHALLSDPRKLRWEELKAPEGLSKSAPTLNPPVMLGGAPNISGEFSLPVSTSWDGVRVNSGGDGNVNGHLKIPFELTGNSIYGRSTTVQPESVRVLPCIKF